jgi:hypothetical protein
MLLVTDWFVRARPDHPIADIKQAKKVISELPVTDSVKALEQICFWLDSIADTDDFKTDLRFQLIDLLDQAAKYHQRKISQEYLSGQRLQKIRENMLWATAFRFWKLLSASYNRCVEDFQSGASGSSAIKKQLSVIIARALRALTLQLKWSLLRYGSIDDRIWGELGRLYSFAETQRNAMSTVEVYPGVHGQSSVRHEFLKAMMLSVSSTDALNMLEQDIAERAVAHFASRYVVQDQPSAGCTFLFDLSMRKPPARVQKGAKPVGDVLYFGAGDATMGLAELIAETRQRDSVPSDVNLGGTCGSGLVLEVLEHLALNWSDLPPSRSSERHKHTMRLSVAPSFSGLLNEIEADIDNNSLDFTQTESWIVEDVSGGGYGAIIPQVKGDWIRVGALVGLQTETGNCWHAGIIRRISQQQRVGIQLLSPFAIAVEVSPTRSGSSMETGRGGDRAVLLSKKPDEYGEITLLLRSDTFNPKQNLDMQVRDMNYLLLPSKLIERGDDFDCARFSITPRS